MNKTVIDNRGMAILAMSDHGQDARAPSSRHGQDARATSRETVGCKLAAEVLRSTGELRLRVTGTSMLPAVWPGDVLSVRGGDVTEALPGDIVLFGREGKLVAHRVVEVRSRKPGDRSQKSADRGPESGVRSAGSGVRVSSPESRVPSPESRIEFVTRGDSLDSNDPPVSSDELLGRVTAIERGSRRRTPHQSNASRLASWILSRSDFATRVVLKVRAVARASCP